MSKETETLRGGDYVVMVSLVIVLFFVYWFGLAYVWNFFAMILSYIERGLVGPQIGIVKISMALFFFALLIRAVFWSDKKGKSSPNTEENIGNESTLQTYKCDVYQREEGNRGPDSAPEDARLYEERYNTGSSDCGSYGSSFGGSDTGSYGSSDAGPGGD